MDWSHAIIGDLLKGMTPRQQAVARCVCRPWRDACAAPLFPNMDVAARGAYMRTAWSPAGDAIAVGMTDGSAYLVRVPSGREVALPNMPAQGRLASFSELAFSTDGALLMAAYADMSNLAFIRIQPLRNPRAPAEQFPPLPLREHDQIRTIAFAPNATAGLFFVACSTIAAVTNRFTLRVWSKLPRMAWQLVHAWSFPNTDAVVACAYSPNGRKLASVSGLYIPATDSFDTTLRVFDIASGLLLSECFNPRSIHDVAWTRDSKCVVYKDDARRAHVFDVDSGTVKAWFSDVSFVVHSPHAVVLVSRENNNVRRVDTLAPNGAVERTVRPQHIPPRSLLSPDGRSWLVHDIRGPAFEHFVRVVPI